MHYKRTGRSFLVVLFVVSICMLNSQSHVFADDTKTGSMKTFMNMATEAAELFEKLNDVIAVVQVVIPGYDKPYTMQMCSIITESAESRLIGVIEQPSNLKGTTLLIHMVPDKEPGYWIYAPKTMRVRQIAGMDQAANMMGLSFNMEDMNPLTLMRMDDSMFRIRPAEKVDGKQCAVMERIYDDDSRFKKQIIYISENPVFPIKIDSFDKDDKLLMTFLFKDIKIVQETLPTPGTLELIDHKKKQTIVVKMQDIHFNNGIQDTFFRLDDLKTASSRLARLWKKAKTK